MKNTFFLYCLALMLTGCVVNPNSPSNLETLTETYLDSDEDLNTTVYDLTTHLKTFPRLRVVGVGEDAQIITRGDVSYNMTTGYPLYVVNGSPYGFRYREVYQSFTLDMIKSVRVLHGITQVTKYGDRALRGVIEINLKEREKERAE